jgi:hypothetical protein
MPRAAVSYVLTLFLPRSVAAVGDMTSFQLCAAIFQISPCIGAGHENDREFSDYVLGDQCSCPPWLMPFVPRSIAADGTPFQLCAATFTDQSSHQPEDENDQDFRGSSNHRGAGSFSGICAAPSWRRRARRFVGRGGAWAGWRRSRSRRRLHSRTFDRAFLGAAPVSIEVKPQAPDKECQPRRTCRHR